MNPALPSPQIPLNLFPPPGPASGAHAEIGGEPYVSIHDVDAMPPFLMSLVSAGDLWMFIGSNGALTAGRTGPDRAMFPYRTADRILGSRSEGYLFCSVLAGGGRDLELWEPWGAQPTSPVRRSLHKHLTGGALVFEESHERLGLVFSWSLGFSRRFGVLKKSVITSRSGKAVPLRLLEGFRHVLPPGIPRDIQDRKSYLALAYMRHESSRGLSIYGLQSGITDRAEPCESLRYAAGWTAGHACGARLLSSAQIGAFREGCRIQTEHEARGVAGCQLYERELVLGPGESAEWWSALDTWLDHAALAGLAESLEDPRELAAAAEAEFADNLARLREKIGQADGWQSSADASVRPHHAANALFNFLRGGLPARGYEVPPGDFASFLASRNRPLAAAHRDWIASLPEGITVQALRELAGASGDPDLARIAGEYLPLTFSRRHGDPSRPWNTFAIRPDDPDGRPACAYQGNWRDVFQNWEALAMSFPMHLPAMISVFLNASSADGYNPYRIERGGVEWEVFDPSDPWSNIGYWGDHQIVYLTRLLDLHERFFPGALSGILDWAAYVSVDIPYRIRSFEELCASPGDAISFDAGRHEHLIGLAASIGNDGKLLRDPSGDPVRATLLEKLLVPALVKLANLVPGGGVWMNTQRPEWNDANNALAGWGLSVVTACQLDRHLGVLAGIIEGAQADRFALPSAAGGFLRSLDELLARHFPFGAPAGTTPPLPEAARDDGARFAFMQAAGIAAQAHREKVYAGLPGARGQVAKRDLLAFLRRASALCRSSATLRPDGMAHGYNLLRLGGGRARVEALGLMLEGQVAFLASGLPSPGEALHLANALRASPLYRPDQRSYLLYPDRELPGVFDRNRIPSEHLPPALAELHRAGDPSIAAPGAPGFWHFQADLRNAADLERVLAQAISRPAAPQSLRASRDAILDLWEKTFRHSGFTGRSAGMFAFEGLGCVYWHMVAKLLLALGEIHARAPHGPLRGELAAAYRAVRQGLGFCKSPAQYGAFPSDPYSHTPAHAGAQQPGMTGQVKEEILARFLELGVAIQSGCVGFRPALLDPAELSTAPSEFQFLSKSGAWESLALPARALAFTFCRTPIVYLAGAHPPHLVLEFGGPKSAGGAPPTRTRKTVPGDTLGREESLALFSHDPHLLRITAHIDAPPEAPGR